MNYYALRSLVANQLNTWITNPKREEWSTFCRKINLQHGIGRRTLERMLHENYPRLSIEEEQLVMIQ